MISGSIVIRLNCCLFYAYLKQKAGTQKVQVTAWHKDTLKTHTDPKVVGFIKDIEAARAECLRASKLWEDAADLLAQTLYADIEKGMAFISDIEAQIDQNKKKWLGSAKYKTKIPVYAASLLRLNSKLKTTRVEISNFKNATQSAEPVRLAKLQLTDSKKVDDVFKFTQKGLADEVERVNRPWGTKLGPLLTFVEGGAGGVAAFQNAADDLENNFN
jgi:hypothetical protein